MKDLALFVKQSLRTPGNVGAIAPSGRRLSREVALGLGPHSGTVVELGPGTGSITRAALEAGVPPENLVLLEMSADFCKNLRNEFPNVRIENEMAQALPDLGLDNVGAVISGLPLLNMPSEIQREIVKAIFTTLRPEGTYSQFTYGPRPPIAPEILAEFGIVWKKRRKIWLNLPPANVYEFTQPNH